MDKFHYCIIEYCFDFMQVECLETKFRNKKYMIIYIYNNKTKIKTTCINLFLLNIEDHGQVVQLPILINYKKKKQKNKKQKNFLF